MVKIHRERGFDVVLYPGDKEHTPPHVHIFYGDEEVKIALGNEDTRPWVYEVIRMRAPNIPRALDIVDDHQEAFLAHWRKYHGS